MKRNFLQSGRLEIMSFMTDQQNQQKFKDVV